MLLDLMIFLKKHYMIYIVIYSAYFISALCFQSMTVGTDEGGGGGLEFAAPISLLR